MVLKVRVRPSSYTVGPQRVGGKHQIDSLFENEKLEWLINKCTGNIEIESIMIKMKANSMEKEPVTGL